MLHCNEVRKGLDMLLWYCFLAGGREGMKVKSCQQKKAHELDAFLLSWLSLMSLLKHGQVRCMFQVKGTSRCVAQYSGMIVWTGSTDG